MKYLLGMFVLCAPLLASAEVVERGDLVDEISFSLGKAQSAPTPEKISEPPASAPIHEGAPAGFRWRLLYSVGATRTYVVPPSEIARMDPVSLLLGRDLGSAAKAVRFAEYGLELQGRYDAKVPFFGEGRVYLQPSSIRALTNGSTQNFWGLGIDLLAGFRLEVDGFGLLRARTGLRAQIDWAERGLFPNTYTHSWLLSAGVEVRNFEFLVEGAYLCFGGTSVSTLGTLRSGLAARGRLSYGIALGESWRVVPALEISRTQRNFGGGTLLAGLNAFSVEEASYLFLLGIEF